MFECILEIGGKEPRKKLFLLGSPWGSVMNITCPGFFRISQYDNSDVSKFSKDESSVTMWQAQC